MLTQQYILILAFFCLAGAIPLPEELENGQYNFRREDVAVLDRIVIVNKEAHVVAFEGDIELTEKDLSIVDLSNDGDVDGPIETIGKRAAQRARQGVWKSREIPYEVDQVLINEGYMENIHAAIKEYDTHTCIRWVPKTSEHKNWIKMFKGQGCKSSVGMRYWREGVQELSLGSGCNHKGTMMHEMMHALGFWHEQSRPDRNKFVEVLWENVEAGEEHNFNKYSHSSVDLLKLNYDYDSIMHYGRLSFSSNENPTLQSVGEPNRELGQRDSFTTIDKTKLNVLYDCESAAGGWSSWSSYGPCDSGCDKYRQRFCISKDKSACAGADDYGIQTGSAKCSQEECYAPVAGHWGRWSAWSACSVSCGLGSKSRTRKCDDPPPKNSGADCAGSPSSNAECSARSCQLGADDCEFESAGFCYWIQDKTDTSPLDWELKKGATGSGNTGPSADHTSGSGHYIFFEASAPSTADSTARLISKEFPAVDKRCMSFWYHLFGEGMGSLNVYFQEVGSSSKRKVFTESGNHGDQWKEGLVDISSKTEYKIIFEGVRGSDFRSDMALDDIKFMEHACSVEPPVTTQAPPTLPPTIQPGPVKALQFPHPLTIDNYVQVNGLEKEMSQLTLCLWARTDDKTKMHRALFSYARGGRHNEIMIDIPSGLRFYLHSGNWKTDFQNISVPINDGLWHHICLTWENVQGTWVFYKDGVAVKTGSKLKRGHVIQKDGTVVLGQEQDRPGGKFNKDEAFPGDLAQVNMWDRVLDAREISQLAGNCGMGTRGNVLCWDDILKSQRYGTVREFDASCPRS